MLLRDARERPGHVPAIYACLGLRSTGHVSKRILSAREGPYLAPAINIHRPIAGDPVEPGCEARPACVEGSRPSPDVGEGVLNQLLRQVSIPQQPYPGSIDRP